VGHPSLSSEFPHDNAEISAGAVWICPELTGPASAELTSHEPVRAEPFVLSFDDGEDSGIDAPFSLTLELGEVRSDPPPLAPPSFVVAATPIEREAPTADVDLTPSVAAPEPQLEATVDEAEAEPQLEPTAFEPDPPAFRHFEAALSAALMAQGASRSAALVGYLLRLEPLPAEALGKDVQLTLQSRGYLDGNLRYTQKWRDLCSAWCAVLRGSSQDFAACGTTTLDRFGADLLAALLAVPATRADELRRGLRKAGIAAFGVLRAA